MNQRALLLVTLLAAVLVFYLSSNQKSTQAPAENTQVKNKYYLEGFVTHSYGPAGELQRIFQGEALGQSAHSHETTVDAPRIQLIENDSPTWIITAHKAWLDAGQENTQLKGDVVATGQAPPKSKLETSELNINLLEELVFTRSKVSITQGPHSIKGEGLQANLPEGTMEIMAKVQSVYFP